MNKRIKEIAEKASKDNGDGYPVTLEYNKRFAEKFGKMLVREFAYDCLDITGGNERILMVAKQWKIDL
jgi:hypothetical protein